MLVNTFKLPFKTRMFNKNQRVWVVYGTGDMACAVCGKYRGSGRYVHAWVNWRARSRPEPKIESFDMPDEFCKRHGLYGEVYQREHKTRDERQVTTTEDLDD